MKIWPIFIRMKEYQYRSYANVFTQKAFITNIFFRHSAVEDAFTFQRKSDNYGKLFSVVPAVAKLFPEWSDYKPVRDASKRLYEFYAVITMNQMSYYLLD